MLVARGPEAALALGRIDSGAYRVEMPRLGGTPVRSVHTLAGGDASDSLRPPLAGDAAMTSPARHPDRFAAVLGDWLTEHDAAPADPAAASTVADLDSGATMAMSESSTS
jgi:hypothetical protein